MILYQVPIYSLPTSYWSSGSSLHRVDEVPSSTPLSLLLPSQPKKVQVSISNKQYGHIICSLVPVYHQLMLHNCRYGTLCIRENPGCLFIATNRDAVTHLTDAQEWAGSLFSSPSCTLPINYFIFGCLTNMSCSLEFG